MPYKDPEKEKLNKKKYYRNNKSKILQNQEKYKNTYNYKRNSVIQGWKRIGIIHNDYHKLYDDYYNTKECFDCGCILNKNKRLDHCHITGKIRNVVCAKCNSDRMCIDDMLNTLISIISFTCH